VSIAVVVTLRLLQKRQDSASHFLDAGDQLVDRLLHETFSFTTRFIALAQVFSLFRIVNL